MSSVWFETYHGAFVTARNGVGYFENNDGNGLIQDEALSEMFTAQSVSIRV